MNSHAGSAVPPPSKHQMAVMIWVAVLPTLLVLNYALSPLVRGWPIPPRTFVVASLAVPIVIYGLMPQLHRARTWLLSRNAEPTV